MPDRLYFDYASSTPVHPDIQKALFDMVPRFYANSESLHQAGLEIHQRVEQSRQDIAKLLKVEAQELTFTSGATESNNLLIKGIAFAYQSRGKHLITSAVEHVSVLDSFKDLEAHFGFELTILPVNALGYVEPETLKAALRQDTILVSLMAVNNETGVIFKTQAYSELVHSLSKAVFHVDAVQALAKVPFSLKGVDAASFSAHKIQGVKGSGLFYKRSGIRMQPLITGGQQENGLRPGTPNAINHILFAQTLKLALESQKNHHDQVVMLNHHLRTEMQKIPSLHLNAQEDLCSPYIINLRSDRLPSQVLLNWLDQNQICISAAATCSSRQKGTSHVLEAMGLSPKELEGVVRISIGANTTLAECDTLLSVLKEGLTRYGRSQD